MLTSLALIGQLAALETRAVAAHALAEALGAQELIVFVRDPDLAVLLPAPGFTHTIPGGAEWRTFLGACVERGSATGRMFTPGRDADLEAWGYRIEHGGVLVLLGGAPDPSKVNEILPLFSLVTAIAGRESELLALDARRRIADTTAAQGEVLARALEQSRDQIRDALTSARESRRRIEEQAEELAAAAEELAQSRTELEALNEELVRSNAALQHSVADAERARSSAEEANHAKSGFLAMMSHELRTPLNAIGGYAGLLEEQIMGPLVPGQREYLARIKRAQTHLLALINDVLNYAKSESGTIAYDIVPLELRSVLASVAPLIEPMATARGVLYDYHAPDRDANVLGDRDKIVQVVLNLLTNAVKFTPRNGTVALRVALSPASALISVVDSGPGIPAEQCASIFEPFVQLERSFAGEREGVGLGLSISRELARGMDGDIVVDSVVGRGSTFTFSVPRLRNPDVPADDATRQRVRKEATPH